MKKSIFLVLLLSLFGCQSTDKILVKPDSKPTIAEGKSALKTVSKTTNQKDYDRLLEIVRKQNSKLSEWEDYGIEAEEEIGDLRENNQSLNEENDELAPDARKWRTQIFLLWTSAILFVIGFFTFVGLWIYSKVTGISSVTNAGLKIIGRLPPQT